MKNKSKAAWASALAVGLAVGAISGANAAQMAPGSASDVQVPPGFQNAKQTLAEFANIAQTDLTLPDGIKWPTIAPAELKDKDAAFEDGFVASTAHLYWLCAWENALVNVPAAPAGHGDGKEVAHVQDFTKTAWFAKTYDDPSGAWTRDVLKPALAGDLTGVKQDLKSCGYYYLNQ